MENTYTEAGAFEMVCPQILIVSGGEAQQPSAMGIFRKSDIVPTATHGNRVIYQNGDGNYMFFWAATGDWLIGADYNKQQGWLYARSNMRLPTLITGWTVWDGSTWSSSIPIRVSEAAEQEE